MRSFQTAVLLVVAAGAFFTLYHLRLFADEFQTAEEAVALLYGLKVGSRVGVSPYSGERIEDYETLSRVSENPLTFKARTREADRQREPDRIWTIDGDACTYEIQASSSYESTTNILFVISLDFSKARLPGRVERSAKGEVKLALSVEPGFACLREASSNPPWRPNCWPEIVTSYPMPEGMSDDPREYASAPITPEHLLEATQFINDTACQGSL
jgi:hypothetical protein